MDDEAKRQCSGGPSGGGWTAALNHLHKLIYGYCLEFQTEINDKMIEYNGLGYVLV